MPVLGGMGVMKTTSSWRLVAVWKIILVSVLAGICVVMYDSQCVYPFSTRTTVEIVMRDIAPFSRVWYTTNDSVIHSCLANKPWYLSSCQLASGTASSARIADVGAVRARSAVFGRYRDLMWRGRMLVVVEGREGVASVFLIDGVPKSRKLTLEGKHRIDAGKLMK